MRTLCFAALVLLSSCAGRPGVAGRGNYYRRHPYPVHTLHHSHEPRP